MCVSAWQTHPRSTSTRYIHRHRLHLHREALTSDTTVCAKRYSAVAIPPQQLRVVCLAWKFKRKPSNAKICMYAYWTLDACAPRVFDFKRKPSKTRYGSTPLWHRSIVCRGTPCATRNLEAHPIYFLCFGYMRFWSATLTDLLAAMVADFSRGVHCYSCF